MPSLGAVLGHALLVELRVDRIRARLARMKLAPELAEPGVVLAPAERAGPVPGGEGRRLVEEEELGEAARLEQRLAVPTAELEPAGDPAPAVEAPADRPPASWRQPRLP